ncbi:MAG: hypothetical protein H0V92_12790 [Pseudonocardiales bacterium]|nr:hypothetical protein [Pseudonocardiales bacterium]
MAEPTVSDPDTALADAVRILRTLGQPGVPVLLHGEEHSAWPVLTYTLRMKLDTRIGLEDVLVNPENRPTTGNNELVTTALALGDPATVKGMKMSDGERDRGNAGVIQAAALLLVERSHQGWLRLLEEHVADASGHCHACSSTALGAPVWPCTLWSIARQAQHLGEQRHGSQGRR